MPSCLATRDGCGSEAWLLLERPLDPDSDGLKQYLITAPATMPLVGLTRLAHVRPRIERSSYENAKDAAGLADYQGRCWPGFHRHPAVVWLAMTWLDRLRRPLSPDEAPHDPPATDAASQRASDAGTASDPANLHLVFDAGAPAVRGATAPRTTGACPVRSGRASSRCVAASWTGAGLPGSTSYSF